MQHLLFFIMQNFITSYINEAKSTYELLWQKMFELNNMSEADFNNLRLINSELPPVLKENQKIELERLLTNIEIKIKNYSNMLYDIKKEYEDFIVRTSTYLKDLDSNPQVKGNMILSRNSLEQNLSEFYNYLKDGYNQIEQLINGLKNVFNIVKSHIEEKEDSSIDENKLSNLIKSILEEKMEQLKPTKQFIDDDLYLKSQVTNLNVKINELDSEFKNLRNKLNKIDDESLSNINVIQNSINELRQYGACNKDEISKQSIKISDSLSILRQQIDSRLKMLETSLNNSIIKKF